MVIYYGKKNMTAQPVNMVKIEPLIQMIMLLQLVLYMDMNTMKHV